MASFTSQPAPGAPSRRNISASSSWLKTGSVFAPSRSRVSTSIRPFSFFFTISQYATGPGGGRRGARPAVRLVWVTASTYSFPVPQPDSFFDPLGLNLVPRLSVLAQFRYKPRGFLGYLLVDHHVVAVGLYPPYRGEVPPSPRKGVGDEAQYRPQDGPEDEPVEREDQRRDDGI